MTWAVGWTLVGMLTVIGTDAWVFIRTLARMAEDRGLLDGSADVAEVGL